MEQKPFAAFLDLITFDKKIHTLQKTIEALRQQLEVMRLKKDDFTQKAISGQSLVDNLRVQVTLQEKEVQELDLKEKAKKKLLGSLSDYREIKAMQAEIDDLKRSQVEYEHLIMQSWNKLEHAQKEAARLQAANEDGVKKIDEEIGIIDVNILEETRVLNTLLEGRAEKVARVPHEWLEHYTTMTARVVDPVVPVESESCSACFASIPKQDMLRLQRKALLQCKMCFRLLYLPSAMERDSN